MLLTELILEKNLARHLIHRQTHRVHQAHLHPARIHLHPQNLLNREETKTVPYWHQRRKVEMKALLPNQILGKKVYRQRRKKGK